MMRPSVREILTEAADTQHTAVLTWQEARALLDCGQCLTAPGSVCGHAGACSAGRVTTPGVTQ